MKEFPSTLSSDPSQFIKTFSNDYFAFTRALSETQFHENNYNKIIFHLISVLLKVCRRSLIETEKRSKR